MSFHLRIFNLRDDATNTEIRGLFSGLSIEPDGVTIVGGPEGEAFVTFNNESDLLQAMRMNGEQNLEFKIATDIDKLKGINSMCTAKLQNMTNTSGKPISDEFMMQNVTSYDAKRRKTDYGTHYVNEYAYAPQPAWPSQGEQREPNPSMISPACHPNQFHKMPVPFPSEMPVMPGPSYSNAGFRGSGSFNPGPMPPGNTSLHGSPGHPRTGYISRQMPFPFRHPPPQPPFHPEMNLHSCPMPPRRPLPKSGNRYQGSLLMSLLPDPECHRFCIKVSDLPADATPSKVWSWVGGREGTALGVILLQPIDGDPFAFVIYDNRFDCDRRFEISMISVEKYSAIAACKVIEIVIVNWSRFKGTPKPTLPIRETTLTKKDRSLDMRVVYFFLKESKKIQRPIDYIKNRSVKRKTPGKNPTAAADFRKNIVRKQKMLATNFKGTVESDSRQFLIVYQVEPTVTATEVLSWCDEGIIAMKLDFHDKEGPRDSDAVAFILFHDKESLENATRKLTGKNLSTVMRTFRKAYKMIIKFGCNCTITEATADGERVISSEERLKPPFVDQVILNSDESFILNENSKYIRSTSLAPNTTAKVLWNQYPKATGVIMMRQIVSPGVSGGGLEGFIAFKNAQDQNEALYGKVNVKGHKRARFKYKGKFECHEAMAVLARIGFEIKVSTHVARSHRRLTLEEAKFIVKQKSSKGIKGISTTSQISTKEDESFIHHLKTPRDPNESEHPCLKLVNLKEDVSACKLHSLFTEALGALTVQFNGDSHGPYESKAIGYLLLRDIEQRTVAKLILGSCVEFWCTKLAGAFDKLYKVFENVKLVDVEEFLSRVSYKSTICESAPDGGKVLTMEELALAATMPPFSLAPGSQGLHYAQLTGIKEDLSACEVWGWFGGRQGTAKGVVLPLRKTDGKGCIAYVAFYNLENREKVVAHSDARFVGNWFYIHRKSEQEILDLFANSSDDYVIKISTESGMDRNLEPAEEKLLSATKMGSTEPAGNGTTIEKQTIQQANGEHPEDKQADKQDHVSEEDSANEQGVDMDAVEECTRQVGEEQRVEKSGEVAKESQLAEMSSENKPTDVSSDSQTVEGIVTKFVKVMSTSLPKEFYIRLKKVSGDVKTASDILSLFSAEGSHAKSATLVRDSDGVGVSAYVMFGELEQRDSALAQDQFSVRCTGSGRAVRLAEFESDHEISECTEGGHDRVLSMEERDSIEQFSDEN